MLSCDHVLFGPAWVGHVTVIRRGPFPSQALGKRWSLRAAQADEGPWSGHLPAGRPVLNTRTKGKRKWECGCDTCYGQQQSRLRG